MSVYVASSWRNKEQLRVVAALREAGIDTYDFRNPGEGESGFSWRQVGDIGYKHGDTWDAYRIGVALDHPAARHGFDLDFGAMKKASACVLVMPCGRSAHIEAGYFVGAGKPLHILLTASAEPELMWRMAYESGGVITCSLSTIIDKLT